MYEHFCHERISEYILITILIRKNIRTNIWIKNIRIFEYIRHTLDKVILYDEGEFERHEFHDPSILPHFEWTKIEISQEIECEDQIIHRVTINGMEKYRKEVESARRVRNLKVYASALWHATIREWGYMKGLSIQIREDPKLHQRISHRDL